MLEKHPIPFSLARRIYMITEKVSLKEIRLKELETLLPVQHYPEIIIKAGINTVLKIPQNKLGNVKEEKERRSYLLFQLLIQATSKPCLLLNKPWKT